MHAHPAFGRRELADGACGLGSTVCRAASARRSARMRTTAHPIAGSALATSPRIWEIKPLGRFPAAAALANHDRSGFELFLLLATNRSPGCGD